jgi:hypothetical protein
MKSKLALASLCVLLVVQPAFARKWADATGKFSVEADLVKVDGNTVSLKNADGKIIDIALDRLSNDDRKYLQDVQAQEQAKETAKKRDPSTILSEPDEIFDKPGLGSRYFGSGNPYKLVQQNEVQADLGLSDTQKNKAKQLVAARTKAENQVLLKNYPSMVDQQKDYLKWDDETQKQLNDILTPDQQARMQEISLQCQGPRVFLRKDMGKALGLTSEQQQKLMDVIMHHKGPLPKRDEMEAQAQSVLTDEQRMKFDKMKGNQISFDPEKLKIW